MANIDPNEIKKFDELAKDWWNPDGQSKPLHDINPVRLSFIKSHTKLTTMRALDIGCGGGLLSEAMAKEGAQVTAIDMSSEAIKVAKMHAEKENLNIDYQDISIEEFSDQDPKLFDVITCMELLEHVPHPDEFIAEIAKLIKPEGKVFFSTLNRNLKSFITAIIGAEYVLRLLPKGTHEYNKMIKPSELSRWCRVSDLETSDIKGIKYNPLTRNCSLTDDPSVNYVICCTKIDI